jgi:restriction system protein
MSQTPVPTYQDLLWPTLKALEEKGGSASNEELSESIARIMKLPDAILEVPHNDGPLTKLDYRAAWARTHLKFIDAIQNSERGVWTLTDLGRQISSDEEVRRLVKGKRSQRRKERDQTSPVADDSTEDPIEELSWEERLLDLLRKIEPPAFERLCQRILRESGFTKVEVTGRSGDGGIDGAGVLRLNLLSFHVRFQCKRYSGSVSASEIRDFRGAMIGRADKGLFLTTGRFTKDAEREAVRDGAPAIDLIDGTELCQLLKRLKLGVLTETVERVQIQADFFASV